MKRPKAVPVNPKPVEPVTLPTQMSADDTAYLQTLHQQQQVIQTNLNAFAAYLSKKYQVAQGDVFGLDGKIVRKD